MVLAMRTKVITLLALSTSLIIGGWYFSNALLKDASLTGKVERLLEKNIGKYGLEIKLGKLHYQGANELIGSQIVIKDREDGSIPIQTAQIKLKFNPLLLLKDPTHPETALREIILEKPTLKLVRTEAGWNFQKYFPKSKKKSMLWQTKLQIREATLDYEDFKYGKYHLFGVNGSVSMRNNPVVSWDIQGKSDFNQGVTLQSIGETRIDTLTGKTVVKAKNLDAAKAGKVLPESSLYRFLSGKVNGQLHLGWRKSLCWLEKGNAELFETELALPMIKDQIFFKRLVTDFTPETCKVNMADVNYQHSNLKLSGLLNLKQMTLQASVKSNQMELADLKHFLPKDLKLDFDGRARADLKVTGSIKAPVLTGELGFKQGSLEFAKEKVTGVFGTIALKDNQILVKQLKADWRHASIMITGKAGDLFKPNLQLTAEAAGFDLEGLLNEQNSNLGINTSKAAFRGEITGELTKLKCQGLVTLGYLAYQQYLANNLEANFNWEIQTGNLKVLNLNGQICGGNLLASGDLFIKQQEASWFFSGRANNLDLESLPLNPEWLVKGKVAGDLLMKGAWTKNQPFDLGSIIGNFQATGLSYQEIFSENASGTYSISQDKLSLSSVELQIGEGIVSGELSYQDKQLALSAEAEQLSLKRLMVGKNNYPVEGILNGDLNLTGSLEELSGKIQAEISKAAWSDKEVGTIKGDLNYLDNTFEINELKIANPAGDFDVKGSIGLDKQNSKLKLSVLSDNIKLKEVLPWLPVDQKLPVDGLAQIQVELDGTLNNLVYYGSSQLRQLNLAGLKVNQGELSFRGNSNEIRLDKLLLTDRETNIFLEGVVTRDDIDLKISGKAINLEKFDLKVNQNSLAGVVDLEGSLTGKINSPKMSAVVTGQRINFGMMNYAEMTAKLDWDATRLSISEAQLNGAHSQVNIYGQVYTTKPYKLDVGINISSCELADVMSLVNIPNLNASGDLTGWIRLYGTSSNPSVRILGDLSEGLINQIPFKGEFDLLYNRNKIIFEKIELKQNNGLIFAKGSWENNRVLKLDTQIKGLALENFNTFLKKNKLELSGITDAEINLTIDKDQIDGKYVIDSKEFKLNKNQLGNLHGAGHFSEGGITIQEAELFAKSGNLLVDGYIAWPFEIIKQLKLPSREETLEQDTKLRLLAKELDAQVSNSFANNLFEVTKGTINGEVWFKYFNGQPDLSGKLYMTGVSSKVPTLTLPIYDLQGTVDLNGKQIQFNETNGRYGKGKFDLHGAVTLEPEWNFGYALALNGTNLYYRNNLFDGFVDTNIQLSGDQKKPKVAGELTTYNSRIGFFGIPRAAEKPTWIPEFDLKIKTGLNTRFRQPGFADVKLEGELKVAGDLLTPAIEGEVVSNDGMLTFYGQTFKVTKAKMIFKNNDSLNPYLELDSNVFVDEKQIFLNIKGQLNNQLIIGLTSQPYLTQSEIYSLLNWSELSGDKQLTMNGVVSGQISSLTDSVFGDFLYQIRKALNADYLYVEPDLEQKEFRFRLGYSISDRLFLSVNRTMNIEKDTEERWTDKWGFDYRLFSNWNVGATYTQEEGATWRLSYQINL